MAASLVVGPHPGPQTLYFETPADIAVYGGSAGGGKSWALLADYLRWVSLAQFRGVLLRRDSEQIRQAGGLWDASVEFYPPFGGRPREHTLDWRFPSGARVVFDAMQYESDKLKYQGAEIALLGFDELTHFTKGQFWYLQSRNRTTCGMRPYTRATCNPDPNSWVMELLGPWVDPDFRQDGQPFAAESGELLWIVRNASDDSLTYFREHPGDETALSLTFIRASLDDNPTLEEKDPGYRARLMSLPMVDRMRLLNGDWSVMEGGNMFKPEWFEVVDAAPEMVDVVRFWDMAATKPKPGREDPDWCVGIKMGRTRYNRYIVLDEKRIRDTPGKVEELVAETAHADGKGVRVRMEQEGGSSGVTVIDQYRRHVLAAFDFDGSTVSTDKTTRAKPFAAQAEAGNVMLLKGYWNRSYLNELAPFPDKKVHDDRVDASSGAYSHVCVKRANRDREPRNRGKAMV